jgi:hypothetical protein
MADASRPGHPCSGTEEDTSWPWHRAQARPLAEPTQTALQAQHLQPIHWAAADASGWLDRGSPSWRCAAPPTCHWRHESIDCKQPWLGVLYNQLPVQMPINILQCTSQRSCIQTGQGPLSQLSTSGVRTPTCDGLLARDQSPKKGNKLKYTMRRL